jgi:ABC-type nitrate/sulfonate/bicarbonate transport system substrate-binding protein
MSQRIFFIVGLLSCIGFFGAADAAEMVTLRYGQNAASAGSLSSLPLTVPERKGFFVREGINLVVVPIPGGTDRIVAALDKGEVDTGRNATPYLIQAVLKGSDAVAIIS